MNLRAPSRRQRIYLALASSVALIACSGGSDSVSEAPSVTTTTEVSDSSPAASVPPVASTVTQEPATEVVSQGGIEVATIGHLPSLDVEWITSRLDYDWPDQMGGSLAYAGIDENGYVLVALGWSTQNGQSILTWRSEDGTEWARTDWVLPIGTNVEDVFAVDGRLVAIGQMPGRDAYELCIWTSGSDGEWRAIDLASAGIDPVGAYAHLAVVAEPGIVGEVRRDQVQTSPPVVFEAKGYRYSLNPMLEMYELTEIASGRVIAAGRSADIYETGTADGRPIWNLDTEALILTVPFDVWNEQYGTPTSPLSLPIPAPPVDPNRGVVEWGGYRVILEYGADRVDVIDIDTGEVVTTSSLMAFERGLSPRFADELTGEAVVSFTWDEWDALLDGAHREAVAPPDDSPESQLLALFSPDGLDWIETPLTESRVDEERWVESLLAVDDRFVVVVASWSGSALTHTTYTSSDGVAWQPGDVAMNMTIVQIGTGPGDPIATTYGTDEEMGSGPLHIATTEDGLTWAPVFFLPPQDDGRLGWLQLLANGRAGGATLVSVEPLMPSEPVIISVGSRTVRITTTEPMLEIFDDSGEVLLAATRQELEQAVIDGAQPIVTYADGVTVFWSSDGTRLMEITDDLAWRAEQDAHEREGDAIERAVLIELADRWYEAQFPAVGAAEPQQLAVADGALLVGAAQYQPVELGDQRLIVLVGHFGQPDAADG